MDLTLRIRVDGKSGKAEIVGLDHALRKAGDAGQDAGRKINAGFTAARQGVQSISQQLASMQRAMVGLAAAWSSFQIVRAVGQTLLETAQKADSLQKSFLAVSGSAQAAAKQLEFARQTAQSLGISADVAASAYLKLAAAAKVSTET